MSYATHKFVGTGSGTNFEISFSGGYIDKGHVKAYIENLTTAVRTTIVITPGMFIGPNTINIGQTVPVGSQLVIYRDTPKDGPLVDFVGGSRITEAALDKVAQQGTFIGAELADRVEGNVAELTAVLEGTIVGAAEEAALAVSAALIELTNASATTATYYAGIATTKANSAIGSASTAAADALAAAASAVAANGASVAAVGAYDSFDDRYLGAKASDPALDNDGEALLEGAMYWNTATVPPAMRVRSAGTWVSLPTVDPGTGGGAAADITVVPTGGIAATDVQAALAELDAEKAKSGANTDITSLQGITSINSGPLAGMRNRIINGACRIQQRGSLAFAYGVSGYGGPDRFKSQNITSAGQFTQSSGTLTYQGVARACVTQTVDVATTDFTGTKWWRGITQRIEGYHAYDLVNKPITVSFLFLSNVTGAFNFSLGDTADGRTYVSTFNAVAGVATRVVISIPAYATVINNNTGVGLSVSIGAITQATLQAPAPNVWNVGAKYTAPGTVVWAAAVGNYISLTELQLEEGTVATAFERLGYTTEQLLCFRYYQVATGFQVPSAVSGNAFSLAIKVPMRPNPTATYTTNNSNLSANISETIAMITSFGGNTAATSVGGITLDAELI